MENDMGKLNLIEEEEDGLIFHVENDHHRTEELELCLVGRFLTDRPIRSHIMKDRMASVWRPSRGVAIKEIVQGVFLFQFYHKVDMQRVYNEGPWSFDNHLLILGLIHPGDIPSQVPLFHISFWVQVHDLPLWFMSLVVGQHLGNFIGKFLEYDASNNANFWRPYMRIRVRVDVRKPLQKQKKFKKRSSDWKIVKFKYERLGNFCFLCGMLGHTEKFCEKLFTMVQDDGVRGWGIELKADARRNTAGGGQWLREEGAIKARKGISEEGEDHGRRNYSPINQHSNVTAREGESSNGKMIMIPQFEGIVIKDSMGATDTTIIVNHYSNDLI